MPASTQGQVATRQFSMDTTPASMRAQQFQREMHSIFAINLAVSSPPERPLKAEVQGYYGRNLRFASLRFSPHSTASPHTAPSSESRLLVACHKQGNAIVSQGGRESHIEAGDFFCDRSRQAFPYPYQRLPCAVGLHQTLCVASSAASMGRLDCTRHTPELQTGDALHTDARSAYGTGPLHDRGDR